MSTKSIQRLAGIILAVGALSLISVAVFAADFNFVGTWKGEYKAAAGAPADAAAPTGGRGGGGRGAGGGAFNSGPQKITLRVKVNKENVSGNFTMGTDTKDIREGRIVGNKLTFKTGLAKLAEQIYSYDAVLIGENLSVTQTAESGRGNPKIFTLMRDK